MVLQLVVSIKENEICLSCLGTDVLIRFMLCLDLRAHLAGKRVTDHSD